MVELTLPRNSRVKTGKTWNKPQSRRGWQEFRVYRWNPDDGQNPRMDTYWVERATLRADGSGRPDQDQERDRSHAHLPPVLPRGHLRVVLDEHRRQNTLACLKGHRRGEGAGVAIYPLPHLRVVKDLVPDLTNFYAQLQSIEPWLKTTTATPAARERRQDIEERGKLDGLYECILCACCSTVLPQLLVERRSLSGPRRIAAGLSLAERQPRRGRWRAAGQPGRPVPPLPLPHHPELRQGVPQGPQSGQGHRRDQEADGRAPRLDWLAAVSARNRNQQKTRPGTLPLSPASLLKTTIGRWSAALPWCPAGAGARPSCRL